jgi:hypothetical protein
MHLIKVSVDINNSCVENVDFGHGHRNHTEFFGLASGLRDSFGRRYSGAWHSPILIPQHGIRGIQRERRKSLGPSKVGANEIAAVDAAAPGKMRIAPPAFRAIEPRSVPGTLEQVDARFLNKEGHIGRIDNREMAVEEVVADTAALEIAAI